MVLRGICRGRKLRNSGSVVLKGTSSERSAWIVLCMCRLMNLPGACKRHAWRNAKPRLRASRFMLGQYAIVPHRAP